VHPMAAASSGVSLTPGGDAWGPRRTTGQRLAGRAAGIVLALASARAQDQLRKPEAAMRQLRRMFTLSLGAAVFASGALADEVLLRGGGRVSGVVVERTATAVVIETGPGRVTLPLTRVEKIVEGRSTLVTFQERAAAIAPGDAPAWAALARWAADRDLVTQSRSAWHRVLAVDPQNPEANAALGKVSLDGSWM